MLAADKLQLQSALKQQATALKEKEFNLHHSNFMTVGTQAAVLAGLDITMFIEFNPPDEDVWLEEHRILCRILKCAYYAIIIGAFCANILVVSQTTALSVLGAGLALRGPDGSMMTATEGLYEERKSVFAAFGLGLALTIGSVLVGVWLLLRWEAAIFGWAVTLWTCRYMYKSYLRVQRRFDFDESDTVDFTDIFSGPAAIKAVRTSPPRRSNSAPLDDSPIQTSRKITRSTAHTKSPRRTKGGGSKSDDDVQYNDEEEDDHDHDDDDDVELGGPPLLPRVSSSRRRRAGGKGSTNDT